MMKRGAGLFLAASLLVLTETAHGNETVTYSYDSLGRLTQVSRSGTVNSGVTADYDYDATDNRTNVSVAVSSSATPLVVGGGFETPDVGTGFLYRPDAGFTGNSGVAGNGSAWGFEASPEGDQVAFIQNGPTAATVSLAVTGLTPGASYTISFRMSGRPGYVAIPLTLAFNGIAIGTFQATTHNFVATTSPAFTVTASSGTLTFTGVASADNMASGIDRVTIAAAGGQP
jgi:YD repeat-containing protein